MKSLGERISQRRRAKKMGQDELGEQIGKSRQMISYYENGSTPPGLAELYAIAKALDCSIYDLLGEEGIPQKLPSKPADNGQYGTEVVDRLQRENSELKTALIKAQDEIIALLRKNGGKLEVYPKKAAGVGKGFFKTLAGSVAGTPGYPLQVTGY